VTSLLQDRPVAELLDLCRGLDIRLWTEAGRLRYDAPAGALGDALRAELVAHKAELVQWLSTPEADPEAETEPDSIQRILKDWLKDLVADGSIGRHLGERSEAKAQRLLEQDELDVEAARDLIHKTAARTWPERYKAAGVRHEDLNP
jgi:hypothetical protein